MKSVIINQQDFLVQFGKQFDETPVDSFSVDTIIEDLEEWSSLVGLSVLAMIQDIYGIRLFHKDLENVRTIGDLYGLVYKKIVEDGE